MPSDLSAHNPPDLAEVVRRACLEAALAAWEDAGIRGLCMEGRWEAALSAIERLNLKSMSREA
ncbi:MAG: acetyltransferase [Proteobacteria bacterium]|nr:acetyltransferase [Pseudomonadota bacterium]HQR03237.1 hypothetical protein [Rhodocyclaceae bacterium]